RPIIHRAALRVVRWHSFRRRFMAPRRRESNQFTKLQKIGLELDPPVDEFSEQPGSSSAIGGRRGQQEYGITGGIAQEDAHDRNFGSNVDANTADLEEEGTRF